MGLFKTTKKPEAIEKYVPPEQQRTTVPPAGAQPSSISDRLAMMSEQMQKLQQGMAVLSANDQALLNAIGDVKQTIVSLASGEEVEEEPTEEEIQAAILAARKAKAGKKK